jgi:hypothetical protein
LFEHFVGRLLDIIGYYSQLPAGNVTNAAGVLLAGNGKTAIEVLEECAQRLRIVRQIGEAHQYFYAPTDDMYFAMHAVFYEGRFLGLTTGQAEDSSFGIFKRRVFYIKCDRHTPPPEANHPLRPAHTEPQPPHSNPATAPH